MMSKKNAIVLFSKAPVAGKCKKRLQAHITAENCARLQEAFIYDAISKMSKVDDVEKIIYFWPEDKKHMFDKFIDNLPFQLYCQDGDDTGERLKNTFQNLFDQGFSRVAIIAVDSPTLPVEYLNRAFVELDKADIVIGPALDSGYYLMGFNKDVFPMFSSVSWGTAEWLLQTVKLIKKHNTRLSLLNIHYDIDLIENLHYLKDHLKLLLHSGEDYPVHTKKLLDDILP